MGPPTQNFLSHLRYDGLPTQTEGRRKCDDEESLGSAIACRISTSSVRHPVALPPTRTLYCLAFSAIRMNATGFEVGCGKSNATEFGQPYDLNRCRREFIFQDSQHVGYELRRGAHSL
jgi:hypothetical protein